MAPGAWQGHPARPEDAPHCNWDVRLSGTDAQRAAIEILLDDVRLEYSIVING
ncbi:hypothetical protein [Novosphingobium profundi]|uniref:hypothetical protein n=1 Tax=Novosphingobium profundi TaxID=1774954 RepID=UPI001FE87AE9|nr:hypothetical protein [Novosphingobium profundi]